MRAWNVDGALVRPKGITAHASPAIGPGPGVRRVGTGTEAPALEPPLPITVLTPVVPETQETWDAATLGVRPRGVDHEGLPSVVSPVFSRFEVSTVIL